MRWHAVAYILNGTLDLYGNKLCLIGEDLGLEDVEDVEIPNVVTLTHEETCASLRLTYAMCYYSSQGTTIRDRHILLFESRKDKFTKRHLNVGMSRATHGKFVHIPSTKDEFKLIKKARR